jgi:chemotaxis-related protein WspB
VLHLIFRLDGEDYALDASRIVEILPLVNITKAARASAGVVGAINYRGAIVPVVDLAAMTLGRASQVRLSTRIVMARRGHAGELVGLIAENATEIRRIAPADFAANRLGDQGPSYLGPIAIGPRGPIQRIELDHLAPRDGDQSPQRAA